jgi:hypothetical protein
MLRRSSRQSAPPMNPEEATVPLVERAGRTNAPRNRSAPSQGGLNAILEPDSASEVDVNMPRTSRAETSPKLLPHVVLEPESGEVDVNMARTSQAETSPKLLPHVVLEPESVQTDATASSTSNFS